MNILILSYGIGGRYKAVAENIGARFSEEGHGVKIVDTLDLTAPAADKLRRGKSFALRHMPHLHGIAELITQESMSTVSASSVTELERMIEARSVDAVIAVHSLGARLLSELKASGCGAMTFFFSTDLYCPADIRELKLDRILLPHEGLRDEYIAYGAEEERLCVTGMPIAARERVAHTEARERLCVAEGGRMILLSSGMLGAGPVRRCVMAITDIMTKDDCLLVLCGENKRLKRELDMLFFEDKRVRTLGVARDVGLLFDAADILVANGSSLTAAEAADIALPVVFVDALPGVNSKNIAFLKRRDSFVRSGETADEIVAGLEFELSLPISVPQSFGGGAEGVYSSVTELCVPKRAAAKKRSVLLIMNPVAGKMAVSRQLGGILETFSKNDCIATVMPTASAGDAEVFAESYAQDFDLVVCCGGDGTMSETASGLLRCKRRVPVGYIPCGSTNDFAEYHSIPTDLCAAAKLAVTGVPAPVDMGRINGRCFINAAEFGVFTRIAYDTPQRRKNFLGFYAYLIEGVKDIANLQSRYMRFTVDGESIEGDFIFGIVAAASDLTDSTLEFFGQPVISGDGLFELVLIRKPSSPLELECIVRSLRMKDPNSSLVSFRRGKHISVSQEGTLNWVLDGEKLETTDNYDIEMIHNGIDLVGV